METYHFRIADFTFRIQTDRPVKIGPNFAPFVAEPDPNPLEQAKLLCCERLPEVPAETVWEHNSGYAEVGGQKRIYHRLTADDEPYCVELFYEESDRVIYFDRKKNEFPDTMQKLFNGLEMEKLLLRHDAMILHSSLVRWQGKAILFSAPSGTGKSTQADLWETYMGSETLNGDRSILRKSQGRWTAFGLPYAGSSGIYRNESAPIAVIVLLEQGPENRIEPVGHAQALRKLIPEISKRDWDRNFMNRILDLLLELLDQVPVFRLVCRPDREAVELLHDTITKEV